MSAMRFLSDAVRESVLSREWSWHTSLGRQWLVMVTSTYRGYTMSQSVILSHFCPSVEIFFTKRTEKVGAVSMLLGTCFLLPLAAPSPSSTPWPPSTSASSLVCCARWCGSVTSQPVIWLQQHE